MRKSKSLKLDKILRPWLDYYKEDSINPNLEYPDYSIVDMLLETAENYPNNMALSYYGTKVTFKDFVEKIKMAARALKNYGVKENDKITVCMPNTPEALISFYAINMVGAIANMVHPLSSEKELEYYLNLVDSKYIIVIDAVFEKVYRLKDSTNLKKIIVARVSEEMNVVLSGGYWLSKGRKISIPKSDPKVVMWSEFIYTSRNYQGDIKEQRTAYDPAVILYSGGTTGNPKGILLSNLSFNAMAMGAKEMIKQIVPGATALSILPVFHAFGLTVNIHTPLVNGMGCVLVPQFEKKKFGDLIKRTQPSFIVGVPTLYEALIQTKFGPKDLSCIKATICGGDALNKTLRDKVNAFLEAHGSDSRIRVGYGLTESNGACCLSPENAFDDGIIGAPFPDDYLKIVKPGTHDRADINEDGEICVSGPSVMMGYYNNDKETVQTLRYHEDGKLWLHTGDVGVLKEDGFFYFSQRIKRMIVSSGYNVYPTYIEGIINSHYAVLTSTVIGIPHPYKGQVAKAFIVLKEGFKANKQIEKEIKELCIQNVAVYALPVEYEFRDKLPQTLVGKVAFRELEKEEKAKREKKKK